MQVAESQAVQKSKHTGATKRGKVMQRGHYATTGPATSGNGVLSSGQRNYGYIPSGTNGPKGGHMLLTQNYTNPQIPTGTNSLMEESLLKQKKATIKKKQSIIGLESVQTPHSVQTVNGGSAGPPQNRGQGVPLIAFHEPHIEEQQYDRRNSRGGVISSPKLTGGGDGTDIQVLNSGRQSNRRQSNLPGIVAPSSRYLNKQQQPYKMNDQVISIIKQYTKQNSQVDLQATQPPPQQSILVQPPLPPQGISRDNPHRFMTRNMTYEDELIPYSMIHPQPVLMHHHHEPLGNMILAAGGYVPSQAQLSQSRNMKVSGGSRGPKTIANRTQGEDTTPASLQATNKQKYTFSNSPSRPIQNLANVQKLREIHSTVQLLQAYQPSALVLRPENLIMDQNKKSMSSFGGSDSDSLQRVFNGTLHSVKQSAQMELKSMKRSEYATKRQKGGLRPPVLPQGIVAPTQHVISIPGPTSTIPHDAMKRSGKTSAGGPLSHQSSHASLASPDERQRQLYNPKALPITKSRNQIQQPNTVREEVVQISANISSTNTSQQKPVSSTIQDLHGQPKTPLRLQNPTDSRSSGIPTMQMWATAGASGSIGSSAGSQEIEIGSADGSASNTNLGFTKRNLLLRPQAIIKVRRRNEQNAVKLATLRQLSHENQRDRNSLGLEVAVIDTLDEEEEEDTEGPPQLRNMNPASGVQRVLQLKTGAPQLTIKTKLGGGEIPVISRNSPLAKDEGPRTVMEVTISDSLHNQRNRLPPSLKIGTTIDVTTSGGGLTSQADDQTSLEVHGSHETGKISKKKIAFVTSKISSDSQVNFNPKKSTRQFQHLEDGQRVSNHRTSKYVTTISNTAATRTNSTPNLQNDQQSSSNSSKIDRILAKIDKNRSDSIKNQLGIILKKTQSGGTPQPTQQQSETQIQSSSLTSQRGDPLLHKNMMPGVMVKQTEHGDDYSPETVLKRHEEIKQLEVQQRKILKIVTTANANTFESKKVVKKKQIKVKGSLERGAGTGLIHFAPQTTTTTTTTNVVKLKQLRDAKSHEPIGGVIIEKQRIYLPAEMVDREFSPLGSNTNKTHDTNSQNSQQKVAKKQKLQMRIQSHEQPEYQHQQPMMIVVSPHQEDMNVMPSKPMKKSILHSMQPHEHQGMLSKNQHQQHNMSQGIGMSSSGDGGSSEKQSTEISTNQGGLFFGSKTNVLPGRPLGSGGATPFDQSSVLCLTSSSVHQQKAPQQHMTIIQDGVSPKDQAVRPRGMHYQTTIARNSIKENPLEHSLKSSVGHLKFSSRYANDQNFLIKEDANEEKDSSSNSNSNQAHQHQQPQPSKLEATPASRTITNPGTAVNSSMMAEELHIEPIDSDDKLFRDVVQANSRKKYSQVGGSSTLYGVGRAKPIETVVVEQSEQSSNQHVSSIHRAVVSQLEQQQRYSNKETDENERKMMLSFTGKHRRFNGSILTQEGQEGDDEDEIASVLVVAQDESIKRPSPPREEDDEAVQLTQGKLVGKSSEIAMMNRVAQDKKKHHWLLDSDRFDIVLQTNAQNQGESQIQMKTGQDELRHHRYRDDEDGESNGVQSDTVIFERDYSSVAGTPPKIAQKMGKKNQNVNTDKRRKHSDDEEDDDEDDTVNMSANSSQLIPAPPKGKGFAPPNSMQRLKKHDSSSIVIAESIGGGRKQGDVFNFGNHQQQQDSYDELLEAEQDAYVDHLLEPLAKPSRAAADSIMSEIHRKLKMAKKDAAVANNPHWVMQKQVKMLPPVDHYLRPTYYDVIYIQPHLDANARRSKVSGGGSYKNLGKALISSQSLKLPLGVCELGPRLETEFNFDRQV